MRNGPDGPAKAGSRLVLYAIGCAAQPVLRIRDLIAAAQTRGYDICLILTPTAAGWLTGDLDELAGLTGHPVRSQYKLPEEPDVLPPPEAILAAPATFNTLNKWALGLADTLALGLLTEGIGKGLPLVALPCLNSAQATHPALAGNVALLRQAGVAVLLGEDWYVPPPPDAQEEAAFPWAAALEALARRLSRSG
jgi:Flavoprotein